MAPLCVASHRQGNLLYALWTLGQSFVNSSDVNVTSCRCRVTSASVSPVKVFVRALDVRLSKSKEADECSYVTVTDSVTTRLNTTCSNGTTILFDTTSQGSVLTSDVATPIDITLTMHLNNMPDIVWIGFTGEQRFNSFHMFSLMSYLMSCHNLHKTCFVQAGRLFP